MQLSWSTATEHNNAYFSIQASEDGKTFREIGQVKGAGNSQVIQHYNFALQPASQGTTYYRLQQTDFDQAFTYSRIQALDVPATAQAEAFPNPGKGIFYIRTGGARAASQAYVTDLSGKTVLPTRVLTGSGAYGILDLSSQAPGLYLLHLTNQESRQVLRLIKQ